MIVVDHKESIVSVKVFGEFSLSDYKEFEELVNYKIKFEGSVSLLFDLRDMAGFTVDMALEEIRFARAHANDFDKIAVLTDSQWVTWSAWISQSFVEADVEVFAEESEAREWLSEGGEV